MRLTLGSLVIVLALAGCASHTASTSAPSEPTTAATSPDAAAAAPAAVATATPAPASESALFVEVSALPDLRFVSGQVTVGKADVALLDGVVRWLRSNPGARVRLEGHTDDLGSREANLAVSERRVESVRRYLVEREIEPARISAVSYGPDHPLCAEKTKACRAKNRRIHFLVTQN